jgi:hypothetical protein
VSDQRPGSVADELAAGLASEAALVDEGALTIDAEQGLAKLGRYQLADPHCYVLRLAEGGIRLGADELWFWTTRSTLVAHVVRRAAPLTLSRRTLENLLSVLIGGASGRAERDALVQLAIGLNAARQLGPTRLWLESVDADGRGHRLELEGEQRVVDIEDGEPGLWVRVEQGWSLGERREAELLRADAGWASVPIVLDGHRISHGPVLPRAAPVHDEGGRWIGSVHMISTDPPPAHALLLAHGIVVERVPLPTAKPGCFAVVEAGLQRDLSFSRFVRDDAFSRLLERIVAQAAAAATLSPPGSKALLPRRPKRAGDLHVRAAVGVELVGALSMFVAAGLMHEGLVVVTALLTIMFVPIWIILAVVNRRAKADVVARPAVRLDADRRRAPALPPAEAPRALPPATSSGQASAGSTSRNGKLSR